ncbi:cytochrome d ubiquinol oxidase subunit II [Gallaecimonas xiamenensis]|uniref:Cytochrome d ubiquinol oxidase subunit II n=1 Tax=Gallaecimonas xiamenensis 3-C-1 TaxID=745411 RepID=K2K2Q2_9GAMM|nr:cytochrome d ubiquinol oxidase subunit II [Gallaecimonas xiamenensis]EKE77129.1 cytochrome d ubiquinol oxidase subunit II [Gallaecimonas xiamenensis 3-C-1]
MELFYFLLLGFAILMYVVLDGFDLGLGILFPVFPEQHDRDMMMRSVSHVWDGNETWLVFGGVILMGAFPAAYATLLPILYLPIVLMLVALIFRGIAFEYRFKAKSSRRWWDLAFGLGSSVVAFCQGLMLGSLVESGGQTLLSPFSVLTAFAVMAGYALLGATYLVVKSSGQLQAKARAASKPLLVAVMLAMVAVSLWNFASVPSVQAKWLANLGWLWPIPLITGAIALVLWQGLKRSEVLPFFCTIALFVMGFLGLVVGLFPQLVPGQLNLFEAAAPVQSLKFMLPGVLIFVPLILGYTLWGYRIFRGKVHDFEEGY